MFPNISIHSRFGLWFGMMILLLAAIVFIDIIRLDSSNDKIKNLVKDKYLQTALTNEIASKIATVAISMASVLLMDMQDQIDNEISKIHDSNAVIKDDMEKLEPLIRSDNGKDIFKGVIEARTRYLPGQEHFLQLIGDGKRKDAIAFFKEIRPLQQTYIDAAGALTRFQGELVQKTGKDAIDQYQNTNTLMLIFGGIALALAGVASFWFSRSMPRLPGKVLYKIGDIGIADNGKLALIPDKPFPVQAASQEAHQVLPKQTNNSAAVR